MNQNTNLHRVFNPRTVAVVGDKKAANYMWLRSLSTFVGKAYSVQIDERELPGIQALGVPNYRSLLDIPEPLDYVIVAVPRSIAPRIVQDCIDKKVGGVMLFTSGFAETGTEEGRRLQQLLTEMARKAKLNLIGPNCVGIYNPGLGLRHNPEQPAGVAGSVGFISQSGTHASFFSMVGAQHGIRISQSVSYGNAVVLDSTDYLEYMAADEQTRIIGMYIEGLKDGRRFFQVLRQAAQKKPVLIWKGGQTQAGARATASHTASLAESATVWEAMIKQCGAIKVDNLEEMVETIKTLLYIKPPTGNRVGLIAMTGGQSVMISDSFAKAGLAIPLLSEDSYRRFAGFFNTIGGSYKNPLDVSPTFFGIEDTAALSNLTQMLDILNNDGNIDTIVLEVSAPLLAPRWQHNPELLNGILRLLSNFRQQARKSFLVVVIASHREAEALQLRDQLVNAGIASFPSFERGARALSRVVEHCIIHGAEGANSNG